MTRKIGINIVLILAVVGFFLIKDGLDNVTPGGLVVALILVPLFAFMMWLRWDWPPEEGREVRAKRKAEKDAETFE